MEDELGEPIGALEEKMWPEVASYVKRYLRAKLDCFGVRKLDIHPLAREVSLEHKKDENMDEICLWWILYRKCLNLMRTFAISILRQFGRRLDWGMFEIVQEWFDDVDNWPNCDSLSVHLLGSIILKDEGVIQKIMRRTESSNFWKRGTPLTSTMLSNRKGKRDPF